MRLVKVVYDKESDFILNIVESFRNKCILETYSMNNRKQMKSGKEILTNLGTKNLPLITFEDENLELVAAIWSEDNPDWKAEIIKKLKE